MSQVAINTVDDASKTTLPVFEEIAKRLEGVRQRAFDLFEKRGQAFQNSNGNARALQAIEETKMNFKALLAPEISIRLTTDMTAFVSTVRRGLFRTEIAVHPILNPLPEGLGDGVRAQAQPVMVLRPRPANPRS
jgi:hypothetical protein